jgi:hypothetical protein
MKDLVVFQKYQKIISYHFHFESHWLPLNLILFFIWQRFTDKMNQSQNENIIY